MRFSGRLTAMLLGATVALTTALSAHAQELTAAEAPSPMCSLLTALEVSDALGVDVSIMDSWDVTCTYGADESSGEFFSVSSNRDPKTLAERRLVFTGDTLDVGGREALYTADTVPTLFVATPDGGTWTLLVIGTVPDGIDAKAAMTHLGELALSRLAGLGAMATAEPVDSGRPSAVDAGLEALFPTYVGGVPVMVESMSGSELSSDLVSPTLQAALDSAGRTIEDVRIAVGYVSDPTVMTLTSITAFQVKGTDISTMQAALLPILFDGHDGGAETAQQVGGKDVTTAELDGTPTYIHARDDILWIVTAVEPALTEVLANLP